MLGIAIMSQEKGSHRRGFTLLELIIVIFLITLILGLSGFFFAGATSSQRFNATTRSVATTLKYAKTLAIIDGEIKTFFCNIDMKTYGIMGKKTMNIPDGINIKVTDPIKGDIYSGTYDLVVYPSQVMPGITIYLWDKKRTARIETDPVAGTVMVRY
mgnify:CR=1 FL=1